MRRRPRPRGWTGGSFGSIEKAGLGSGCFFLGIEIGRVRAEGRNLLSLFFLLMPFVKGDSHPELCAQRTDKGEGFLCVHAGSENGGYFLSFFPLATYLIEMKAVERDKFIHSF
jgi:hypothetical protein